jgi:hypothetical protein
MIVAVAVTWEATVPIMANAISTERVILAARPNRRSNSSGIEVIPYCIPISEIFPAMPEKMNIPRRYGIAVRTALKPSV